MSSDETTKPGAPDAKAIVDKIAEAAPTAGPSGLNPATPLDSLKEIDRTILRINK